MKVNDQNKRILNRNEGSIDLFSQVPLSCAQAAESCQGGMMQGIVD